jgi:2-alkyl-3-oxoalkanoate reductase
MQTLEFTAIRAFYVSMHSPNAVRQRVLVLGASGFIGKRVVSALSSSDWAVPVAAGFRTMPGTGGSAVAIRVDARDAAAMRGALTGIDAVVNCVAGDAATIVASAQALFAACAADVSVPRVVSLSSMMVYGCAAGTVDEAAPLRGDYDAYSAAKAEVERLARNYPNVVHLRPGIVYGPGSPLWTERIGGWLREQRLGDLGSAALGCCNLVHVDDVAEAVVRALRLPGIEGEAFNLSMPSPPSWNEYFRQFAGALGTGFVPISRSRLWAELYLFAPVLKLAEIFARVLHRQHRGPYPLRPWLLRLCNHSLRLDVAKAERVLGMRWIALDEGLRQSANWLSGTGGMPDP